MMRIIVSAFFCLLYALGTAPADEKRVPVVMHVHSTWSGDGVLTLDKIAEQAADKGIQAVILGDHCLMKIEYGVFPLRGLLKKSYSKGSVLREGPAAYLREIESVNQRHPGVLLIPGIEVAAHWYWTGSLLTGNLTLNNWHKHILAAGMYNPEDYTGIPVTGNETNAGRFMPFLLWPLLLVCVGIIIAFTTKRIRSALLVSCIGIIGLANNWPFRQLPYARNPSRQPYQALIDYVHSRAPETGITFWNHPDAPDYATPVKAGPISLLTPRYPSAVTETTGYTGFAYFQEGDKQAGIPNGSWDKALRAYCDGKRPAPVWAGAELDYREEGKLGTFIDSYQNIVILPEQTAVRPDVLLRTLQKGRFYAVTKPQGKQELILKEFTASSPVGRAGMGEELHAGNTVTLTLSLALAGDAAARISCSIISDGAVIDRREGTTPETFVLRLPVRNTCTYFRLEATAANGSKLVSNPVFVRQ